MADKEKALEYLKRIITPNMRIYGRVTHRGTRRVILEIARLNENGTPKIDDITYYAGLATGSRLSKDNEIIVPGSGFCAIQHVVDNLACALSMALDYERM